MSDDCWPPRSWAGPNVAPPSVDLYSRWLSDPVTACPALGEPPPKVLATNQSTSSSSASIHWRSERVMPATFCSV
jgi:hypothetical protein